MIVRLKENDGRKMQRGFKNFNSMIVRLKVHRSGQLRWYGSEFQFYDSPIKRRAQPTRGGRRTRVSIL